MKLQTAFMVVIVAFALSVTPSLSSAAGGANGEVYADVQDGQGSSPPPPPDNGPNEPENNVCGGGLVFTGLTRGTHDDKLGSTDPADWFGIELFRTESLVGGAGGATTTAFADTCGIEPLPVSPTRVIRNDFYPLRVTGSGGYKLTWEISPNDARIPGFDIGDTPETAFSFNALPSHTPPVPISGSLPARHDQLLGPDQDWFRLNTPLLEAPSTGETNVAIGLLTAQLSDQDCNGGSIGLQLYGADGLSGVGDMEVGCGVLTSSCITLGLSTVYAQASVESGRGTGYDFIASTSPLYFVWLNPDGSVDRGNIDMHEPWCDPLVPVVLSLLRAGDALVDEAGNVIAHIPPVSVVP